QLGSFTVAALLAVGGIAAAGTITNPSTSPFNVPGDSAGNPLPFLIQATGFIQGQNVFVEICDGNPPTMQGYDVNVNCDSGTSPAPFQAQTSAGNVTFDPTDPNFRIFVFKGPSPSGFFNCEGPTDPDPNNGLPTFTNCQIRVSSNNSASTTDQAYKTMT